MPGLSWVFEFIGNPQRNLWLNQQLSSQGVFAFFRNLSSIRS